MLLWVRPIFVQADFIEIPNPLGDKSIKEIIDAVAELLKMVAIGVGIIMIVWGGIQIMIGYSTGEKEQKVTQGKKTISWALIGVAIVTLVDFIVGLLLEIID